MIEKLYAKRFELFFFSLLAILFGSLIFPLILFERILMPLLFLLNILTGILLISKKKKLSWFFIILFVGASFVFGKESFEKPVTIDPFRYVRLIIYFLFYVIVTVEIIKQVWRATEVNKNVIIGLMSGYIALGLVAFLMFLAIELATPGSFEGILFINATIAEKTDTLLYYSYITLLTIGYGEVIPVTAVAQKAAILTGLVGQFYIVIVTAVVVEKYIRHSAKSTTNNN